MNRYVLLLRDLLRMHLTSRDEQDGIASKSVSSSRDDFTKWYTRYYPTSGRYISADELCLINIFIVYY